MAERMTDPTTDMTGSWRGRWADVAWVTGEAGRHPWSLWGGRRSVRWSGDTCRDTGSPLGSKEMTWDSHTNRDGSLSEAERLRLGELPSENVHALELLQEWLSADPSYDRSAWPRLQEAIETNRLSHRRRFGA